MAMRMGGGHGHGFEGLWLEERVPLRPLRRLFGFLLPYRGRVILALALMLLGSAMSLIGPLFLKSAIDQGILRRNTAPLLLYSGLYLVSRILRLLFARTQTLTTAYIGQGVIHDLRQRMFDHLQALPLDRAEAVPPGVILSRFTNDISALANLVSSGMISLLADLLTVIGIAGVMLFLSPALALTALLPLPALVVLLLLYQRILRSAYRRVRSSVGTLTHRVEETIRGMAIIQVFGQEERMLGELERANRDNLDANNRASRRSAALQPLVTVATAVANALVLGVGALLILHGQATVGMLAAFLSYLTLLYQPLSDLTQQTNTLQAAAAAAEKIFSFLDEPQPATRGGTAGVVAEIRFDHVSFSYTPGRPILQDLSFTIPAGSRVAVVGPTGAGKSTLVSLLLGFFSPGKGRILVGGIDLAEWDPASLRQQVALVPQEPFLWNGTVAENLLFGAAGADEAEMVAVAQRCGAHRFIQSLPQGYASRIRDRGFTLSTGQRQLLAVTRALLRRPRLLILDEATANLDPGSEAQVMNALDTLPADTTLLTIAHRLATVEAADHILVLEGGCLVEHGSHEDLLRQDDLYARMYRGLLEGASVSNR